MTPLDRLIGLTLASIQDATTAYLKDGNQKKWEQAMGQAIKTSVTATYLAATAQRLGYDLNSPLFKQNRLTRAERADIQRQIDGQMKYFRGFIADIPQMTPGQIAARANLYAAGQKSFYYQMRWSDWDIPSNLLPGQQACQNNCKCSGSVIDNGDGTGIWRRVMHATEAHCTECPPLAGDHPIKRRAA